MSELSFAGDGSSDVTEFIRAVQKMALAQGRQRDDEWRIDQAVACLSGPALTFYFTLEEQDHQSWKKFCQALINRFSNASPAAPPAAAAPPPQSPWTGSQAPVLDALSRSREPGTRRGYIYVDGPKTKFRLPMWFLRKWNEYWPMNPTDMVRTLPPLVVEMPDTAGTSTSSFSLKVADSDQYVVMNYVDCSPQIGDLTVRKRDELQFPGSTGPQYLVDIWAVTTHYTGIKELSAYIDFGGNGLGVLLLLWGRPNP